MATLVTVSPKFQVVIPKEIRRSLDLRPGQKLQVVQIGSQVTLVSVKDIKELYGFAGKMDLSDVRDHSERF